MFIQILEVLTVGFPFCAFKFIGGQYLDQYWLIVLGIFDATINVINLAGLVFLRRRVFDSCLLAFFIRVFRKPAQSTQRRWQDLGNSLDVALSFSIVAFMVGADRIHLLPPAQIPLWSASVVLNVFGAGLGRLTSSIKSLKI